LVLGGLFPRCRILGANLTRLSAVPTRCGKAHLFGLGGALPLPFASRICWREAALLETLSSAPAPGVLVVHPPPYGVLDQVLGGLHTGSRGIARWITSHQPNLVLCGHVHERPGMATMGTTTVINCALGRHGGGGLIDFDGAEHRVAMLSPMALSPMV
jgi:Icc-related predicted phosphoesterase